MPVRQLHPMKWFIVLMLVAVLAALGGAGIFMLKRPAKDGAPSNRMARALALRVALSVALFVMVWFSHWMGWIQPTGIPTGR